MELKSISLKVNEEEWKRFYSKYRKNSQERLRELVKMDLEDKIPSALKVIRNEGY